MSLTLASIIAAAAPVALDAISNFARENRGTFNALLKQSKTAVFDISKKISNELSKHEIDGWTKDREG